MAAWQAMNPTPPVSDEVTKKRLLPEDAVQQKNFDAAAGYYRAAVDAPAEPVSQSGICVGGAVHAVTRLPFS